MTSSSNHHDTAVLGLGIMGMAIADNLQQDGILTASWNRSPKADAPGFAADIANVLSKARLLLVLVTDGKAVTDVLELLTPHLTNEHIVVQCATVKPQENIQFEQDVKKTGASFIEALIGGSSVAVKNRRIQFYIGGDETIFNHVEPVLKKLSSACIYLGQVGTASVAKLAMNLNIATQVQSLCESYAYAISNGLSDDQYFKVLRNNTAWNYLAEYKEPKLRDKDYQPQFAIKNMLKDVRLALETEQTRFGLRLLKETQAIFRQADEQGLGSEDMIALYKQIHD